MYRISKEFAFSASHQLLNLLEGHKCAGLHGHNYVVMLELASDTVDASGFIIDVYELKALKEYIDDVFDHAHLNDVMDVSPSTENVAKHFYDWCKALWPQTAAVRVSETPKIWAEFRP